MVGRTILINIKTVLYGRNSTMHEENIVRYGRPLSLTMQKVTVGSAWEERSSKRWYVDVSNIMNYFYQLLIGVEGGITNDMICNDESIKFESLPSFCRVNCPLGFPTVISKAVFASFVTDILLCFVLADLQPHPLHLLLVT